MISTNVVQCNNYVSGFVMVSGMTSGFTIIIINHTYVKILIITDKFAPLAVALIHQFIALYMSKWLNMNCLRDTYVDQSQQVLLIK